MRSTIAAVQILVLAHPGAGAAGGADVERWCAQVADSRFPAADRPSAAQAAALKGCDAEALYYGIGVPADRVAARACAFAQLDAGDDEVFGGSNVLMMIYANGRGVTRDLDAAMAAACEASQAPAECEARVRHLAAMRERPADFDLCDDITSGYMQGFCEAHAERVRAVARARRRSAAVAKLPEAAREELAALEKAAKAFFEARVANEVDLSGTGRAAFSIAERASLEDGFVEMLERAARGEAPGAAPRQYREADAALNAVCGRIMRRKPMVGGMWWGTVTPAGIREAQRAWLPYRDAWARFGRALLPGSSSEGWKELLTRQRVEMLAAFDRD